jgi:hypothetical protein
MNYVIIVIYIFILFLCVLCKAPNNMLLIFLYFSESLSFSVPHTDSLFDTKLNIKLMKMSKEISKEINYKSLILWQTLKVI